MHRRHQALADRFVEVAKQDSRLVAIALVGSNATGTADEHSDLDLILVTEDDAFAGFVADRDAFLASIAVPLFIESWGRPERWFTVFEGGGDGEVTVVPYAQVRRAFDAPFVSLLDKRGILAGVEPTVAARRVVGAEDLAGIQRRINGFWHDYGHFASAWSRGQWWWANGQLEVLRGMCANLMRLAADPTDPEVGDEPYWKVELTLPRAELARLEATLNTLEPASLLAAGLALAELYAELARQLVEAHGLVYPSALERLVLDRLAAASSP